jgi:hypothetical protein
MGTLPSPRQAAAAAAGGDGAREARTGPIGVVTQYILAGASGELA